MTYKYGVKRPFLIAYLAVIFIGMLLTLEKWYSVFNSNFVIISVAVHSHISNLSLSMIAYAGIGYSWLLFGTNFRFISMLGAILVSGNFVCETLMGFMNTTDIIDAVYGVVGVLVAYIYLFLLHKYGLTERLPRKG